MKISPIFIVISILAILWNIMGIFQMLSAAFPTPEILEKMKPGEIELLDSYPWWLYLFFGAGVFNGTAGSILMLLRKPLATPLFLVSWLGGNHPNGVLVISVGCGRILRRRGIHYACCGNWRGGVSLFFLQTALGVVFTG